MVVSDALSRAPANEEINSTVIVNETVKNVMKIHEELNHRKTIQEEVRKRGWNIKRKELEKILSMCEICMKKDRQCVKTCHFVETREPGEKIAIDILEISPKEKILTAIDYFSRVIFAKVVETKEGYKALNFLKEIYAKFPYKCVISDNGREFNNDQIKEWMKKMNIKQMFSIAYYHKSNGRIERVNRTIRNALRKQKGSVKTTLADIVKNYNNIIHRGIGLSPLEALKPENREKILKHTMKYKKEFKERKVCELKTGDEVLIKKELRKNKMDNEFERNGKVLRRLYNNVYEITTSDGSVSKKHISQLKKINRGNVGL